LWRLKILSPAALHAFALNKALGGQAMEKVSLTATFGR
jgi:hypothetical protein